MDQSPGHPSLHDYCWEQEPYNRHIRNAQTISCFLVARRVPVSCDHLAGRSVERTSHNLTRRRVWRSLGRVMETWKNRWGYGRSSPQVCVHIGGKSRRICAPDEVVWLFRYVNWTPRGHVLVTRLGRSGHSRNLRRMPTKEAPIRTRKITTGWRCFGSQSRRCSWRNSS